MDRRRAAEFVELVLHRLDEEQATWPLSLVREVAVFGSFARGAPHPNDVDLLIVHDHTDRRWGEHFAAYLSNGRDPYSIFRQLLIGRRRGSQLVFDFPDPAELNPVILWRRGDSIATALGRLRAIPVEPSAGRAERDAMLPALEGLEEWVARPDREVLCDAVARGAITMEQVVLDEGRMRSRIAQSHVESRWSRSSPLFRAACAVVRYWEQHGSDPRRGHLHGVDIDRVKTPYFGGFQLRYLCAMPVCLTLHGGQDWLEVVHPTRTKPLRALRIIPQDHEVLADLPFG